MIISVVYEIEYQCLSRGKRWATHLESGEWFKLEGAQDEMAKFRQKYSGCEFRIIRVTKELVDPLEAL